MLPENNTRLSHMHKGVGLFNKRHLYLFKNLRKICRYVVGILRAQILCGPDYHQHQIPKVMTLTSNVY